jgi:type VI secretion system protein ImpK
MRLVDSFMPLIGYVVLVRDSAATATPPYQQVRGGIQRLLTQSETCLKSGDNSAREYDLARFMVCAWIDEVLLASSWSEKGQWQREQLQRVLYNTMEGGVEAFEKLNQLGLEQREVREVYYVCLSLGFRGRFINPGDDFLLDQLRSSNLKLLGAGATDGELFPEAFPEPASEARDPERPSPLTFWLALGAPLLLFGVLHLVFRFSLGSVADKLF